MTTPKLNDNETTIVAPVGWTSKQIPRVVRSTLSAETYAFSAAIDRIEWIWLLWAWLKDPTIKWKTPKTVLQQEKLATAVTDCKSLYDLCVKTSIPSCSEQRTTLECLIIRERLKDNLETRWIHSRGQLADCLTKAMDSRALRECMHSGKYSLYDETMTLKERANRREAVGWYQKTQNQETEPVKTKEKS